MKEDQRKDFDEFRELLGDFDPERVLYPALWKMTFEDWVVLNTIFEAGTSDLAGEGEV